MVAGLNVFREHFKDFQESYVLIGGVACYLAMEEAGMDFRATKDLDIVLCAEALDTAFIAHFWEFVKAGGYQNQQKSTGDKQFYRFDKPTAEGYPFMLELFSRQPDQLTLTDDAQLTPIPAEEDISSLSAILLDDDYYQCIQNGKLIIDDVSILGAEFILPFRPRPGLTSANAKQQATKWTARPLKNIATTCFVCLCYWHLHSKSMLRIRSNRTWRTS